MLGQELGDFVDVLSLPPKPEFPDGFEPEAASGFRGKHKPPVPDLVSVDGNAFELDLFATGLPLGSQPQMCGKKYPDLLWEVGQKRLDLLKEVTGPKAVGRVFDCR